MSVRVLFVFVLLACAVAISCRAESIDASAIDGEWIAALLSENPAGAGDALDADLEWTNSHGRTRGRAESLESLPELADDFRGETEVTHFSYGHIHAVTSAREGTRMMRVWALRPEGWRVLGIIATTLVTGATPFAASGPATGDCDNPCRTMPYVPSSDNARQIATIFQRLKMDEWHPDPVSWSPFVLDDVYYVTETARLSKADRVTRLTALKETGAPSVPGDPVVAMRIHDFDDSAVMIARHTPYRGGDPYYSLRVWAFRDGRWQLANTQQTVIRSTDPSPAS